MPGAVARRLQALEATRTARALADFRAAFHAWLEGPCGAETLEEAEARVAELRAALSPAELAQTARLEAALEALIEPATPPAGVARAAAVVAEMEEFGVGPGAPPYLALEALAAHFRRRQGEGRGAQDEEGVRG